MYIAVRLKSSVAQPKSTFLDANDKFLLCSSILILATPLHTQPAVVSPTATLLNKGQGSQVHMSEARVHLLPLPVGLFKRSFEVQQMLIFVMQGILLTVFAKNNASTCIAFAYVCSERCEMRKDIIFYVVLLIQELCSQI